MCSVVPGNENVARLQIGKADGVGGDCVQQIAHRWVISTVANEDEAVEPRNVVQEIRNEASTEIVFPEVTVGEKDVRWLARCRGQRAVYVEDTGEVLACAWPGHSTETVGWTALSWSTTAALEQEVEVGRQDSGGVIAVREAHEGAVRRRGFVGREEFSNSSPDDARLLGIVALEAAFEQTESHIGVSTTKTGDFGMLFGRDAGACNGGAVGLILIIQVRSDRGVDPFVHFSYELTEIRQPGRVAHRDARAGQEDHLACRLCHQEVFG